MKIDPDLIDDANHVLDLYLTNNHSIRVTAEVVLGQCCYTHIDNVIDAVVELLDRSKRNSYIDPLRFGTITHSHKVRPVPNIF